MLNARIKYLYAQIANYRDQIALTSEPELKATLSIFLDIAERELRLHLARMKPREEASGAPAPANR